jgi:hypothetical protein
MIHLPPYAADKWYLGVERHVGVEQFPKLLVIGNDPFKDNFPHCHHNQNNISHIEIVRFARFDHKISRAFCRIRSFRLTTMQMEHSVGQTDHIRR